MIWVVVALFVVFIIISAVVAVFQYIGRAVDDFQVRLKVNKKEPIQVRNRAIIERGLERITQDSGRYAYRNQSNHESALRQIIEDVCKAEGRTSIIPEYRESLAMWSRKLEVPADMKFLYARLLEMKDEHLAKIAAKRKEDDAQRKESEERRRLNEEQRVISECERLARDHKDLLQKFCEIADRKVSVIDDYGDENWDALETEIPNVLIKIVKAEGVSKADLEQFRKTGSASIFGPEYGLLEEKLREVFLAYHSKRPELTPDIEGMSGVDFEVFIAQELKRNGFEDVAGTPATGDQGADLIARKNGRVIVIQAKRYAGQVGNKAVQEIIAAVQFYRGTEGWAITNSTFTPSAKALAQKANVTLVDGPMLRDLPTFLRGRA